MQARNLLCLSTVSPTGSQHKLRWCLNELMCEGDCPSEGNLTAQYGANSTAVLYSDLLDTALSIHSHHSSALTVSAQRILDSERSSLNTSCAQQVLICLRMADVQHSILSCSIAGVQSDRSAVTVACESNNDAPLQLLPLSMCPVCLGDQGTDVLQQCSEVLRRMMQTCQDLDRCQRVDASSWEELLQHSSVAGPHPSSTGDSLWQHRIGRVFSGREPWMHCMAFFESAAEGDRHQFTAIVLAPHLQNCTYNQTSDKCWSLEECSSSGGAVGRIGVLLQAAGFRAVTVVARDWMALQAMALQKADASNLRQLVDEALLFAAK